MVSQIMLNLKKLLYSHLYYKDQYICRSSLKKFYKYQKIFYSHYNGQLEINAQYNAFNNSNDNKNKIKKKEKEIKNFTQEYKKNIINSNNAMIIQKDIEKLHPRAKSDLKNIYEIINKEFNKQCILYTYTKLEEMKMKCTIQVIWPYKASFSSVTSNKKTATKNASLQCLNWLYKHKKIKQKGLKPILYNYQNKNNLLNSQKYLSIDLTSHLKIEIQSLIDIFDKEIKSIITVPCTIKNNKDNLEKVTEADVNANFLDFNQMHYNQLKENSKKRKNQNKDLPIISYKEEILNSLQNNQILVIKGDTGCGKSTQIPQFILDAYEEHNKACECNIIVSEPRRISAVSLAYRVAWERGENIGDTVGYHIRFENKIPQVQYGSILYCTTGILLRKLELDRTLKGVSHIIIDEAHERSLQTDILLKSLRDILKCNSHIKLIIMSASINAEIFQQYFSSIFINIPGKLHDVKMHFIDDIHLFNNDSLNFNDLMKVKIPFDKIVNLIAWIIKNKPPGAILCFLPGWQEIKYLYDLLQNTKMKNLLILPLHSKVTNNIQKEVFKPAPDNFTKIILATDIAETGITIQDIRYVIDTAIKREIQWNEKKSLFNLNFSRISQANIFQRKGRAGRVKSGESYHLITRSEYSKLDLYPKPEILKIPLDKAIIICKTLSDEKIYDFFNSMIESPNKTTIISTVNNLKNLGILDDDENLTSLGKYVSRISLTPKLSKAIILSCIFQCLSPILLIVTAFSNNTNHYISLDQTSNLYTVSKEEKLEYHKTSDHIALLKYFKDFEKHNDTSISFSIFDDCKIQTVKLVEKLCMIHINELISSKMISSSFDFNYLNINAKNNELIRAVLFAATNNLIKRNAFGYKKNYFTHHANNLVIENNKIVKLKNESVNHNRKKWPSDLLTYIDKMEYTNRYSCLISDTSMISSLSVLLFSHGDVQCTKIQNKVFTEKKKIIITINDLKNINLICEPETADLLLKFRNILWNVVDYIIKYEGTSDDESNLKSVKLFKDKLMVLILKILEKSSRDIDNENENENEHY